MYWNLMDLNSSYLGGKNIQQCTKQTTNQQAKILLPRDRFAIHVKKARTSFLWDFGINKFMEFFQVSKWNGSSHQYIPRILS